MMSRTSGLALAASLLAIMPAWAGQSNSLLDLSRDGKQLLVANTDNGTVTVIDVAQRRKVREIAVGSQPEGVSWIGGGPLALVTLYEEDTLALVDTASGSVLTRRRVPADPYGVVTNAAGTRAWVSHDTPGVVTEWSLPELELVRTLAVAPFTRGLAVDQAEARLFATGYYTGTLHALDLKSGRVVDTWPGRDQDNLLRAVALHPRRPKAYLPHLRSRVTAAHGFDLPARDGQRPGDQGRLPPPVYFHGHFQLP